MKNAYSNNDLKIIKLKYDYLRVNYSGNKTFSFGGCQSWFEKENGGEFIKKQGCGLIAMSDVIIYLAVNSNFSSRSIKSAVFNNPISYNEYLDFVLDFNNRYVNLSKRIDFDLKIFKHKILGVHTNNIDGRMGKILNHYFADNNISLKAKWGIADSSVYSDGNWFEKDVCIRRIKDMLSNDIPAIVSVGPRLFGKMNGINCYEMSKESNKISYKFTGQKIVNHYFIVTAVIEDNDKKENGDFDAVMYEISSWGKKYYIAESEIRRFRRCNSSFFTNVLYIEKTDV